MLLWFCETKVTKKAESLSWFSAFFYAPQKNFTNYLEKENSFCIFVVKLRILFPFHDYKFEGSRILFPFHDYKFEGSRLKADGHSPLAVRLDGFRHPTG